MGLISLQYPHVKTPPLPAKKLVERGHPGKAWDQVLRETLEAMRGQQRLIEQVGDCLGVSNITIYNWCRELEIDPKDYMRAN